MKHSYITTRILAASLIALFAIGCGKKVDEALLAEYNAKKGEAEKVIADATEGLKKLNEEHTSWMAKISEASATKAIDSVTSVMLMEKMHGHEPMIPVVQAGVDSLKYYVAAKTETNDEVKSATAGLNAHLAAVSANWKALWDAHSTAGTDITAALANAVAPPTVEDTKTTTSTKATKTTKSEKHETAKHTPGGTPKVPPTNMPTTSTPTDQSKHETAKKTPGGTPKTPPASTGTKK